jgi:hypothetical protein
VGKTVRGTLAATIILCYAEDSGVRGGALESHLKQQFLIEVLHRGSGKEIA